ncbi:MAG: 4-alpha-glucanotransferase [Planctomycetes bacterium]|nr:4-alpha-glucanotransferase [Planctomycetota bacterium]
MRLLAQPDSAVSEALHLLGKQHLVLVVHDVSFPLSPGEDVGHGSPYSRAGRAFLESARAQGFDAVQLGPQGRTSDGNPSPYDATLFSRNELSLGLADLVDDPGLDGLVSADSVAVAVEEAAADDRRADHSAARVAIASVLTAAHARLASRPRVVAQLHAFARENADWLLADTAFDRPRHADIDPVVHAERYALAQWLFHRQHASWRLWLDALGMTVWGDLQIGMSPSDEARFRGLFLRGYRLGAPPSRTNPSGQPWGYPVLDPDRFDPGEQRPEQSAIAFLRARMAKTLREYDGVRIDHPHGLVCPWVYRSDLPDAVAAVQQGARLFESPGLPDHPALARFARVRPEQLNADPATPRHADDWVAVLDDEQVDTYSVLFDAVAGPPSAGARPGVMCEVLSTMPYPLQRVMERHGFGRYRVTQKADPDDPHDVYRAENARPEDWIMVGNHDTPSVWRLARGWLDGARGAAEARYLAHRLRPGDDPAPFAAELRRDVAALVHAKVADALASAARGVKIFFSDLCGEEARYNEPGTVGPHNWTLRVPADRDGLAARAAAGRALDLRRALADALRARGLAAERRDLIARLERR